MDQVISLYFVCKEGKRWTFDDGISVSQLIAHGMWDSDVICEN